MDTNVHTVITNDDSTYTVRTGGVLAAKFENGGDITLTSGFNYTATEYVAFGVASEKIAILDLNGKTLNIDAGLAIAAYSGAILTINDSVGGGGVVNERSNGAALWCSGTTMIYGGTFTGATGPKDGWNWYEGSFDLLVQQDGNADINGGTFGYVYVDLGRLNINGGYVGCIGISEVGSVTIFGGHVDALDVSGGTVFIYGGTFGFDPEEYVDTDTYTVTKGTDDDGNEIWTVTEKDSTAG